MHKTLKKVGRHPVSLKVNKEYNIIENYLPYIDGIVQRTNVVPIISVSNRTGQNISILKDFLFGLVPRSPFNSAEISHDVFHINDVYQVKHVGLVVTGISRSRAPIKVRDTWFLGPNNGDFFPVKVKSLHNNIRQEIQEILPGEHGCICIKLPDKENFTRSKFIKGMFLTNDVAKIMPNIVKKFTARILVLHHHTSINTSYQSVVHMGSIQQSAKINYKSEETLRTGNVAIVEFEWLFRPEYVEIGTRFFAREGTTRIAGEVVNIGDSEMTDSNDNSD